jgi:hypothetical protein
MSVDSSYLKKAIEDVFASAEPPSSMLERLDKLASSEALSAVDYISVKVIAIHMAFRSQLPADGWRRYNELTQVQDSKATTWLGLLSTIGDEAIERNDMPTLERARSTMENLLASEKINLGDSSGFVDAAEYAKRKLRGWQDPAGRQAEIRFENSVVEWLRGDGHKKDDRREKIEELAQSAISLVPRSAAIDSIQGRRVFWTISTGIAAQEDSELLWAYYANSYQKMTDIDRLVTLTTLARSISEHSTSSVLLQRAVIAELNQEQHAWPEGHSLCESRTLEQLLEVARNLTEKLEQK